MANKEVQPSLLDALAEFRFIPNPDRKAGGYYSKDGDSWFLILEDVPYKRVRVDGIFTAFEDMDTGMLVGLQLKGITKLMSDLTKLGCMVDKIQGIQVVALLMQSFKIDVTGVSPDFKSKMYTKAIRAVPDTACVPQELASASS